MSRRYRYRPFHYPWRESETLGKTKSVGSNGYGPKTVSRTSDWARTRLVIPGTIWGMDSTTLMTQATEHYA